MYSSKSLLPHDAAAVAANASRSMMPCATRGATLRTLEAEGTGSSPGWGGCFGGVGRDVRPDASARTDQRGGAVPRSLCHRSRECADDGSGSGRGRQFVGSSGECAGQRGSHLCGALGACWGSMPRAASVLALSCEAGRWSRRGSCLWW